MNVESLAVRTRCHDFHAFYMLTADNETWKRYLFVFTGEEQEGMTTVIKRDAMLSP